MEETKKIDYINNKTFKNIIEYLEPGDCIVRNNTKVIPARLYGKKDTGAWVGGLIGQVDDKGVLTATNCNATGNVTGLGNVGGFIGGADWGGTCNISNSSASGWSRKTVRVY